MIDTEALRKKVIDLAIKGKLTEQLPEDGDAGALYAQIQEEKANLIKTGKIKKEKPLSPIMEESILFPIPNTWKWVHVGEVIKEIIVPQRDKPPFSGTIPWCRIEDREGYYLNGTKSGQFVSEDTVERMNLRVCPVGTVLNACSGASIGTILITTVECCTNQTFNGLVCSSGLYNWYLFWYLKALVSDLKKLGTGSAMAYISQEKTRSLLIPLPPLAEQKRIVEKIDMIMAQIHIIDDLQKQYESNVEVLKAKIIDAGIRGQLTEQLPEDGDAESLYEKIQSVRFSLVKKKTIRAIHTKPISENMPFSIPGNWKWTRIGAVEEINLGFTYRPEYVEKGVFFLSAKDITGGRICFSNARMVSEETYNSAAYGCKPQIGDVLFCRVGTIGKPQVVTEDVKFCIFVSLGFFRDHSKMMNSYYVAMWMNSSLFQTQVDMNVKGALQKNLNTGWLKEFLFPLPPLAEQKRIVERIDSLLKCLVER